VHMCATVLVVDHSCDVTVPLYIKRTSALHSDDADGTYTNTACMHTLYRAIVPKFCVAQRTHIASACIEQCQQTHEYVFA
jgi:hypothetical protein